MRGTPVKGSNFLSPQFGFHPMPNTVTAEYGTGTSAPLGLRYHEQLTVCYPFQDILARPLLRYGLAQRCAKFIHDSDPQHESRHVVRKNIDHFSQVRPDGPQRPGKLPDVLPEILS